MKPKRLEIYLARIEFRLSNYTRPCVVIDIPKFDWVKIARISSAMDLYKPHLDFLLDVKHSDFRATGLIKTSYISGEKFFEMPVLELGNYIGHLKGDLANDFAEWFGG